MLEAMAANKYTVRSPFLFLLFFSGCSILLEASEPTAEASEVAKSIRLFALSPSALSLSHSASLSTGRSIGSWEELLETTHTGAFAFPLFNKSDGLPLIFADSNLLFLRLLPKGLYKRPPGALRRLHECATLKHGRMLLLATHCRLVTHSAISSKAKSLNQPPKLHRMQNRKRRYQIKREYITTLNQARRKKLAPHSTLRHKNSTSRALAIDQKTELSTCKHSNDLPSKSAQENLAPMLST